MRNIFLNGDIGEENTIKTIEQIIEYNEIDDENDKKTKRVQKTRNNHIYKLLRR